MLPQKPKKLVFTNGQHLTERKEIGDILGDNTIQTTSTVLLASVNVFVPIEASPINVSFVLSDIDKN